ncbi:MAG: AMIN domain-containing protein, partial [Gemmatimonadota bacterium]|nr:AMIN domain-containing protein [Gemmatimonadota bacterium]
MKPFLKPAGVLPVLALLLAALPAEGGVGERSGRVTAVRVEPGVGQTELTVQVSGGMVEWNDFALGSPPRLVVDISGARSSLARDRYEGIQRGGVSGIRTSQYLPDVVRVVIDLERAADYSVTLVDEGIRISIASDASAFQPWSSGPAAPGETAAPVAAAPPFTTRPPPAAAARATPPPLASASNRSGRTQEIITRQQ